ncbi:kinase-like domain-containing protein [Mycena leptocephala]|nr:kinase-like domain-containing protein [Mycena leptocephala]
MASKCDDCGLTIPLRQAAGQCPKCVKSQDHDWDSAAYKDIQKWPPCSACGITRKDMASSGVTQSCGESTCNLILFAAATNPPDSTQPSGGSDPLGSSPAANATNEASAARLLALCQHLKLPLGRSSARPSTPGTHLTTTTLLTHEHGGGLPGDSLIMVRWETRSSKNSKIDAHLSSASKKWSTNIYMEVTLHPFGGCTPTNAPIYLHEVPKKWKHFLKHAKTSPFICLELYIDYDAWKLDRESIENMSSVSDMMDLGAEKQKELRSSNAAGDSGCAVVQKQSDITYRKITCITTVLTGWLILGTFTVAKFLTSPSVAGAWSMPSICFSQLANKPHRDRREIYRPLIVKWFLDAFYRFCKTHSEIIVDTNVAVADAFLAVEVDRPSAASGVSRITDEDEGLTWLVERKHPTTVIKFSGTLVHRSHRRDLRSTTISAFAHFVFGYSKRTLVIADLQGTPCLVRNNDGLILFDVMTHTKDGDSGIIGDFGVKGMKSFVDDHQCTDLCRALTLKSLYALVMPDDEDEEKDSDPEDDNLEIHV